MHHIQHHQQHFHAALKYFKHFIIHSDRTFVDRSIGTVLLTFAFPIHMWLCVSFCPYSSHSASQSIGNWSQHLCACCFFLRRLFYLIERVKCVRISLIKVFGCYIRKLVAAELMLVDFELDFIHAFTHSC